MTITIPEWVLWVVGIPLVLLIIAFAVFGWWAAEIFSKEPWR